LHILKNVIQQHEDLKSAVKQEHTIDVKNGYSPSKALVERDSEQTTNNAFMLAINGKRDTNAHPSVTEQPP
jgi:hypothetical protein